MRFLSLLIVLAMCSSTWARTFTDVQGRKIEAELISVDGDEVKIKTGGKEFSLPISRFSESDQEYIRKWEQERSKPQSGVLSEGSKPGVTEKGGEDPIEVKPGATLSFAFPESEKDFRGNPASFSVRIPKDYDPEKPVPLFVFLGGGAGSNSPSGALSVTRGDFVCVGLPYPDSGRNPRQRNMVGEFDVIWSYWKPMIAKLEETVPNIDPKVRVIGGFSNGAHAIDALLANPEFSSSFSAYVLIDGGGGNRIPYRGTDGKHLYYAWGEKSPVAGYANIVIGRSKRGKMKGRYNSMKGVGHQFPKTEKDVVKSWLYDEVIPDLQR